MSLPPPIDENAQRNLIDLEDDFEAVKYSIKRQPTNDSENGTKKMTKYSQPNKKGRIDLLQPGHIENSFHIDSELSKTSSCTNLDGTNVLFPYSPYPSQVGIMRKIITTLRQPKGHLLIESPTGTGKTMMLLCAALAWQYEYQSNRFEKLKRIAAMEANGYGEKSVGIVEGVDEEVKIYYASRTHKQLNQAISELKKSPYRPKMALLGSRKKLCQNKKALKSSDLNQACLDLLKGLSLDSNGKDAKRNNFKANTGSACPYFNRAHKLVQLYQSKIHDIEDLVRESGSLHSCPYFATREMAEGANLIFTPYNYLIDPFIRDAMGIQLNGAIVIVDEAHNIEDSAREAGSLSIGKTDIDGIHSELLGLLYGRNASEEYVGSENRNSNSNLKYFTQHSSLMMFVTTIGKFLQDLDTFDVIEFEKKSKIYKGQEIAKILNEIGVSNETLKEFQRALHELVEANSSIEENGFFESVDDTCRVLSIHSCRILGKIFWVLEYVLVENAAHTNDYVMVISQSLKQASSSTSGHHKHKTSNLAAFDLSIEMSFWLLSPSVVFKDLSKRCKAVILTSGSLSPLQSFQSELSTVFSEIIEAPHIIEKGQVWSAVVSQAPNGYTITGTYKNSETFDYQDAVGDVLLNLLHVVPYGVLCFLPSFSFLDKLIKRWEQTGLHKRISELKQIFIEPRNTSNAVEFDTLLSKYYACIDAAVGSGDSCTSGAIFFAVYRGKASEGINFINHYARAVIAVGIPYPNVKDLQIDLKRKYNDRFGRAKNLIDGNEWYEIQAYRALNQAIGRCIRHQNDWGAIILLDSRYANKRAQTYISKWLRDSIEPESQFGPLFGNLCKFFSPRASGIPSIYSHALHPILPSQTLSIGCQRCFSILLQCQGSSIRDYNPLTSSYGAIIGPKMFYYEVYFWSLAPNAMNTFKEVSMPERGITSYMCVKCSQTNKEIFMFLANSTERSFLVHKHFTFYRVLQ